MTIPIIPIEKLHWVPETKSLHGTFTGIGWTLNTQYPGDIVIRGKTASLLFELSLLSHTYYFIKVNSIFDENEYIKRAKFIDVTIYLEKR